MVRKIFLVMFIISVVALATVLVNKLKDRNDRREPTSSGEAEYTDLPTSNSSSEENSNFEPGVNDPYSDGEIILMKSDGGFLNVSGGFNPINTIETSDGFYALFKVDGMQDKDPFDIFYDEPSNSITVYLYKEPLRSNRDRATNMLLEEFNLSLEELCTLNVSVITNIYVSPTYGGLDLGLSYCPGNVSL